MSKTKIKKYHLPHSMSQKVADNVATTVGSWKFVIIQSGILFMWIFLNVVLPNNLRWDPYTFTLLNLFLSFQAAYTAPFIMMSQNRQSQIDRKKAEEDYQINKQAEKEVEIIQMQLDILYKKLHSETPNEVLLAEIKKELAEVKVLLGKSE
jgi:uncharacterized membrane protein